MPAGPFDRRSKRSRCAACSSSHLKCNGANPCSHCHRRSIACTYPTANRTIKLDQSRVKTIVNFSSKGKCAVSLPTPQVVTPSPTTLARHLFYFDVFAKRNNFVANTVSYDFDVKLLLGTEPGNYLIHAVTALGALQSSRLSEATRTDDFRAAMGAYSSSVVALREAMAQAMLPSRLHVLWTTLFLGMFELMNSESGDGWLVHMVHGTGAALQASGPSLCISGAGQSFFLQARVFEVSRALLLGDSTFLSRPEWKVLSQSLRTDGHLPSAVLDNLLDLIIQCSRLRVKTGHLIQSCSNDQVNDQSGDATKLAMEGLQLRSSLEAWREASMQAWTSKSGNLTSYDANLASLSNVFFAAISIFLSGVFDYDVLHWRRWGLAIPTLPEDVVQGHVQTILELTAYALDHTSISPLLFLFSLRIAGARSYEQARQQQVLDLLTKIAENFTVARIFQLELRRVWQMRAGVTAVAA